MHLLLIGNSENRRTNCFTRALEEKKIPYTLLSYLDLLEKKASLENFLTDDTIIRIDSPGENFAVEKHFISLGARETGGISEKEALALSYEKGRILYPIQKFAGFRHFLQEVNRAAGESPFVHPTEDILTMFDKPKTNRLLRKNNILSPPLITGYTTFEELIENPPLPGLARIFIKLPASSSASGMAAIMILKKTKRMICYTTLEMLKYEESVKMYNSLKVKKITDRKQITSIADWILKNNGYIETWIPKKESGSQVFDIRVLVIGGAACHSVVRTSSSPFTNLHLGNSRGPEKLSAPYLEKIETAARKALDLFPGSLYAGVDIAVSTSGKIYVLELNPFGDLLPSVLYKGKNTYQMEIEKLAAL